MKPKAEALLSRRERQIMDVLFSRGPATAQEVLAALDDAPSYSTIRTILKILEEKGFVKHREEGVRYVWEPSVARETARRSALRRILKTFFEDSAHQAVAALLDPKSFRLSRAELDELSRLIEEAKEKQQ